MAGQNHSLGFRIRGSAQKGLLSKSCRPARLCGAPLSPGSGMWRWSLHKKVDRDPGKSPALVRILLRELEKVGFPPPGRPTGVRGRDVSPLGTQSHQRGVCHAVVSPLYFPISNIFFTLTPLVEHELTYFKKKPEQDHQWKTTPLGRNRKHL